LSGVTLAQAQKLAYQIFKEINEEKKLEWSPFVVMTDLLEEAGEVASTVKGLEGYKAPEKPKTKEMLANELSDLLYSLFVLAEMYGIELEETYLKTVKGYKARFLRNK